MKWTLAMTTIELNEFQTPLEVLTADMPEEVKEQMDDFIQSVPFIQHLISPHRKRAKDLQRDERGRIIVDIAHPHILEDMDYFRPAAIHFEKHGCYTKLKPNTNPSSPFGQWFREETRRCLEGYVRESDGEWITGDLYFYLNYSPIMIAQIREDQPGVADRIEAFPEMWEGVYWRYHYLHQARNGGMYNAFQGGNHAFELARRGAGKSYSLASLMAKRLLVGESKKVQKRVTSVLLGYLKEYLQDKDGTLSKFEPMMNFVRSHTEWPNSLVRNSMSDMMWRCAYIDPRTGSVEGKNNVVMGLPVKDDDSKARGKRGWIFIEEFGSFPSLIDLYNTIMYSVEEGGVTFALIYGVGTAGSKESEFSSAQEIMYHPVAYKVYNVPNVYDKATGGSKDRFCFFFPAYVNRKGCYNSDGVSDVTLSLYEILMDRYRVKYSTTDQNTLIRRIAEMPIVPQEAILQVKASYFPAHALRERLAEIDNDPSFYAGVISCEVSRKGYDVSIHPVNDLPIRNFPLPDNKSAGHVEIFAMPEKDADGKVQQGRYIAAMDPYDNDQADTSSLGSFFVLDLFTDEIVCEYTGRPTFSDDFYRTCCDLAILYDCRICYENNKKGLFAYCSRYNLTHLLEDTLEFLRDRDLLKARPIGNAAKGVTATAGINAYARKKLAEWLVQPVSITRQTDEGEVYEQDMPNLCRIKNRALLQELIAWNDIGNFDRVSAMGILMLYRESMLINFQEHDDETQEEIDSKMSFFNRNLRRDRRKPYL
jgi:hypothetical protein